jgi:hypothetical protein
MVSVKTLRIVDPIVFLLGLSKERRYASSGQVIEDVAEYEFSLFFEDLFEKGLELDQKLLSFTGMLYVDADCSSENIDLLRKLTGESSELTDAHEGFRLKSPELLTVLA